MKEWLKDFVVFHHGFKPLDSEIDQYLRDHPLPLPSDEDIERVVNTYIYTRDRNVFRKGAKWIREQITGK